MLSQSHCLHNVLISMFIVVLTKNCPAGLNLNNDVHATDEI